MALMARTEEKRAQIQSDIENSGGTALSITVDVTEEASVAGAFSLVQSQLDAPSVFIYNAGIFQVNGILDIAPEKFEYAWKVNCFGAFPVPYIEANVPQAWAAGSVFQLLQAILGITADAPNKRLYVNPCLPHWLPDITLRRLEIGNARVDLRFWREEECTRWDASVFEGNIDVQEKPWQPWQVEN